MRWRRGWRASTSIRPGRCGARASCARTVRRATLGTSGAGRCRIARRARGPGSGRPETGATRAAPAAAWTMAWEWLGEDALRLRSRCSGLTPRRACRPAKSPCDERVGDVGRPGDARAEAAPTSVSASSNTSTAPVPPWAGGADGTPARRRAAAASGRPGSSAPARSVAVQALAVDRCVTHPRPCCRASHAGTSRSSASACCASVRCRSSSSCAAYSPRRSRCRRARRHRFAAIATARRPLPAHRRTSRAGIRSRPRPRRARPSARAGRGLRLRRRRGLRRQLAHRADRVAEQRGVVDGLQAGGVAGCGFACHAASLARSHRL